MLPEFSDVGPAKASIAAFLPLGLQNKVWEVLFDIRLDCGACSFEPQKTFHLVGDQLEVRRPLKGQELLEKMMTGKLLCRIRNSYYSSGHLN